MPYYPQSAIPEGRGKYSSTALWTLPGIEISGASATQALAANQVRYGFIYVSTPITLDRLGIEVTTQGSANTTARLGIYNADLDWQPTSLIVDAGTVAVDSTGVKTATINTILAPGRYLLAINTDGAPTLRGYRGSNRYTGLDSGLGANAFLNQATAQTYGAFPSTGTTWASPAANSAPNMNVVFCRVNAP